MWGDQILQMLKENIDKKIFEINWSKNSYSKIQIEKQVLKKITISKVHLDRFTFKLIIIG